MNHNALTPQQMVTALYDKGFSQAQIAELAKTTQPNIYRIGNGSEPKYELGKRIETLYLAETIKESA